jgi:hypothetical protein
VLQLALTLIAAPALVGAATLAARRWGQRLGGLVSAFPAITTASLAAAYSALPRRRDQTPPPPPLRHELPLRMAATAGLVAALSAAAAELGPHVGGILTALPVLASILAGFTLAQHGARALQDLLRGMVSGMAAFGAAVLGALATQASAVRMTARGIPLAT